MLEGLEDGMLTSVLHLVRQVEKHFFRRTSFLSETNIWPHIHFQNPESGMSLAWLPWLTHLVKTKMKQKAAMKPRRQHISKQWFINLYLILVGGHRYSNVSYLSHQVHAFLVEEKQYDTDYAFITKTNKSVHWQSKYVDKNKSAFQTLLSNITYWSLFCEKSVVLLRNNYKTSLASQHQLVQCVINFLKPASE